MTPGTATVVLTMTIGWTIFPRRREVGLLAGALVAYDPQFLFLSAAVNNEVWVLPPVFLWCARVRTSQGTGRRRFGSPGGADLSLGDGGRRRSQSAQPRGPVAVRRDPTQNVVPRLIAWR